MIIIKNKLALQKMQTAGSLLSGVFQDIAPLVRAGITTLELDLQIESMLRSKNLVSQAKGYRGYKHATCISVNDVVVHGIPGSMIINEGDLVKVDICVAHNGYCADMARSFFVGAVSEDIKKLVSVAESALNEGIKAAVAGNRLSDISYAVQKEVEKYGFGIVEDFAGHGIGKSMHEDPEVLNFGLPGKGPILRPGMTLAIEPMITMGDHQITIDKDGWTARTKDGSIAAHVEDTIAITEGEPKIFTRPIKG